MNDTQIDYLASNIATLLVLWLFIAVAETQIAGAEVAETGGYFTFGFIIGLAITLYSKRSY